MDRCASCGAAMPAGAAWCGQCFAGGPAATPTATPAGSTLPAFGAVAAPSRAATATLASAPPRVRRTRWAKTTTTFGPVGRVLLTLLVMVPLTIMVVGGFADFFAWGGAAVYAVIVVPWALRDIWRVGQIPVG